MLVNDKGNTEKDPYDYYAGGGDVESWGRVHKSIRDAVGDVLSMPEAKGKGPEAAARAWFDGSKKYSDLANVGFGVEGFGDFGADWFNSAGVIGETITSAKDGQRYLAQMRETLEIPGGEETGGTDNKPDKGGGLDFGEKGSFSSGLVLGALAVGGWLAYRKLSS